MKVSHIIHLLAKPINALFILLILTLSSCGKDSDDPTSNQLEGVWGLVHAVILAYPH